MSNPSPLKPNVSVVDLVNRIAEERVPLQRHKDPWVAAAIGFCTGGFGLGFYLENIVDSIVPLAIWIGLIIIGLPMLELPLLAGPFLAGYYGYARAKASNSRMLAYRPTVAIRPANAIVVEPPLIPAVAENIHVTVKPPPPPLLPAAQNPITQKLKLITELKQAGHMTESEYEEKRRELIGSI